MDEFPLPFWGITERDVRIEENCVQHWEFTTSDPLKCQVCQRDYI